MHNFPIWSDTPLKILQQILQDFWSVSDHFGTLCVEGLEGEQKPSKVIFSEVS